MEILIEYVSNENKAGKLTFISNGEKILDKVPVGVAPELQSLERFSFYVQQENSPKDRLFYSDYLHDRIKDFTESYGDKVILTTDPIQDFAFKSENDDLLKRQSFHLTLEQNDLKKLQDKLSVGQSVKVTGQKRMFLFFPKNVDTKFISKSAKQSLQQIKKFSLSETNVYEEKIKQQKEAELQSQQQKPKNISPSFSNINKTSNLHSNNRRVEQRVEEHNDLDPFDVMFMYSYPEMAPIYRPNSLLAWMLYLNHNDHHDFSQHRDFISPETSLDIKKNINQIPGFEDIQSVDIKNKSDEQGYCVKLYADKDKKEFMGEILFDKENGYVIKDGCGTETYLKQEQDSKLMEGEILNNGNTTSQFSIVPTITGYSGNWEITPENGIPIKSGFDFNKDNKDLVSRVGEVYTEQQLEQQVKSLQNELTINVNNSFESINSTTNDFTKETGLDLGIVNNSNINDFTKEANFNLDVGNNWESKSESKQDYTPPPPPPKDDYGYTNDPYNNSSSFSM